MAKHETHKTTRTGKETTLHRKSIRKTRQFENRNADRGINRLTALNRATGRVL